MSVYLHPWLIASWATARWLVGWIIPVLWARAVYGYARDAGHASTPAAIMLAAAVFALAVGFVILYCEYLAPATLSEGADLLVTLVWTVPVDVACVLVVWLPRLGLGVTVTAWLVVSVAVGAVTVAVRLGVLAPPRGVPSQLGGLALAGSLAVDLACRHGGSLLVDHVGVAMVVLAVAAVAVLVAVAMAAAAREPADLDAEIAVVGLDSFIARCRLVDGPSATPGHPDGMLQALYDPPRGFGAWRIAHVCNGSIDPGSGKYEYRYLKVPRTIRTVQEAVAWSYSVGAGEYVPLRRT